jgi:hypothetical protein
LRVHTGHSMQGKHEACECEGRREVGGADRRAPLMTS